MFAFLRRLIPDRHPLRLFYHKIKAFIAAVVYGFPSRHLIVVGVTGTNGKTTTVNLITNILNKAGYKVGMTSTVGFQIGDNRWMNNTKQSTASPFVLQKLLRKMVKSDCKYAIVEVTSHAIVQSRVLGVNFDVAVITNVTGDHVEYHGSFSSYLDAKGGLFRKVSKGARKFGVPKVLVVNSDDEYFNYFDQFVADRKISYGLSRATVYAEKVDNRPDGSSFVLHVPNNAMPLNIAMPGKYNVYNALAASSVCMALGVTLEVIRDALNESSTVVGRFESVDKGQKFSVIVDYAHTPDALESLFALYSSLTKGKFFVVFGATGGGRDKAKRSKMGEIAHKYADYIVVTNDDPYDEDVWDIINQVSEGIPRNEGDTFWRIPDRYEALRLALTLATDGDTVVVAGKGSEEIMIVGGKRLEWNDKKVIEGLLTREVMVELSDDEWVKRPNQCFN